MMTKLLTLNEVIKELEELPEFIDWAVNYLSRKDTLSTYTHASSVTAILDYWMLECELPFYEFGELKRGKDILDALVYPDHKGDYQSGMESLLNTWKINPQELVALIQQEGFAQPECLKALAPIKSPALINYSGAFENVSKASHASEKRQSQLHSLIWRIDQALSQKKRPTAQQIWNEIQHRHITYDTGKIIQEVNGELILWRSGYGNEQKQLRTTFDKTLSTIRKTPPL
jgi:hypothetical protein